MTAMSFGPGEEKLAQAFELIADLQRMLIGLSKRADVDRLVIDLLLADTRDPKAMREAWRQEIAGYYPAQALRYSGKDLSDAALQEVRTRIEYWTERLELRCEPE